MLRFLLLIALGFLFTETTTGAPLREGLEWGIAPLRTLGIRTRNWSLAVSVTLQFVPWILGKLAQPACAGLTRKTRPRGGPLVPKAGRPNHRASADSCPGHGRRAGDSRRITGYDPAKQRTPVYQLRWSKRDTLAAQGILAVAAMLWWVARIS